MATNKLFLVFRTPELAFCNAPCERELDCGHMCVLKAVAVFAMKFNVKNCVVLSVSGVIHAKSGAIMVHSVMIA